MNHVLLVGAGFSKNWNGWLAYEVKYKLYCRLSSDPVLRDLLGPHRGTFEDALSQVQKEYKVNRSDEVRRRLGHLQEAILDVFGAMNRGFEQMVSINFSQYSEFSVVEFLSRFKAIFTLNQDLLLELHYEPTQLTDNHREERWTGRQFPGMQPPSDWQHSHRRLTDVWSPMSDLRVEPNLQPIFKLHGSVNWRDNEGTQLLVMGSGKRTTKQEKKILNWYNDRFKSYLEAPDTRLMVIGYGFLDDDINEIIYQGWQASKLKMFVVDPRGLEKVPTLLREIPSGVSTRELSSTFSEDELEHAELMRFFAQ